jgi:hypothetical protein
MSDIKAELEQMRDLQRRRFWELGAAREQILAVSGPLRAERDDKAQDLTPRQRAEYDARIREAEQGLYEIEVERGEIAKALRGADGKTWLGPRLG